jgi:hypothetical protein
MGTLENRARDDPSKQQGQKIEKTEDKGGWGLRKRLGQAEEIRETVDEGKSKDEKQDSPGRANECRQKDGEEDGQQSRLERPHERDVPDIKEADGRNRQ